MTSARIVRFAMVTAALAAAVADVKVNVDWATFLARHDMAWDFVWAAGGDVFTIRQAADELNRCGPHGDLGSCCLAVTSNPQPPPSPGIVGPVQIALASTSQRLCSPSGVPPNLCCLQVDHDGTVSGCHAQHDTRWDFNQFFFVNVSQSNASLLTIQAKGTGKCLAASNASTAALFSPLSSGAEVVQVACGGAADASQAWTVTSAQGPMAVLVHVETGLCLDAEAREAGLVRLMPCKPSGDNAAQLWQPLCNPPGARILKQWTCAAPGRGGNSDNSGNSGNSGNGANGANGDRSSAANNDQPTRRQQASKSLPLRVALAACNASDPMQVWQATSDAEIINGGTGLCLTDGGGGHPVAGTCKSPAAAATANGYAHNNDNLKRFPNATTTSPSTWQLFGEYLISDKTCLGVDVPVPFCDVTVCPAARASNFEPNASLLLGGCVNGDRSQFFRLDLTSTSKPNLVPLTWATSAWVGNGELGARVQAQFGSQGELLVYLDNARLKDSHGHRTSSGLFQLQTHLKQNLYPARVRMKTHLHNATLSGTITAVLSMGRCCWHFHFSLTAIARL